MHFYNLIRHINLCNIISLFILQLRNIDKQYLNAIKIIIVTNIDCILKDFNYLTYL